MEFLTQLGYNEERMKQANAIDEKLLKARITVQHNGMHSELL